MAAVKKNTKITKFRKHSFFNIGTLLFGTVFIYMVITAILYLTQKHVTSYEVKSGAITGNYRFHALALRQEEIVTATQSGSIRYLEREGNKVAADSTVCAINEHGSLEPVSIPDFSLNSKNVSRLHDAISNFTINYSDTRYQSTYDLKASVEGIISEFIEQNASEYISTRNQVHSPNSGFVIFNLDGFETVTEDDIQSDMFDSFNYSIQNLRSNQRVKAGDPVFKIITSEEWAIYFPIDERVYTELVDRTKIRFRFLKDNVTFTSPFSIVTNNGERFGRISVDSSLVRYATDRFLEIELVMNKKSGLKIPSSSIVERNFYKIPADFAIKNPDTEKEITIKVEHFEADGSSKTKYITANVYRYDKETKNYLVDKRLLSEGDYIVNEKSSSKRTQITEDSSQTLHGVYNINKGYCVFREITVIDENEEYCVVESNNIYGLAAYDYIVLDASQVTEDEIVY